MTKMESKLTTLFAGVVLVCLVFAQAAQADEGMWTFDNFPSKTVATKYGFTPSQEWLDHVRLSSLRIAGGCSASFISPQGLVMTNHHCVVECVEQLSTAQQNLEENGFSAKTPADEKKCPDFELDQLIEIRNVTKDVLEAMAGKTGDAANKALNAKRAELEQSCGSDASVRCDVVSLYHGGVYDLYRYKRYDDVRLVFAPEFSVAQFGGDPDNFNFPRFDFDIGLVRAYEGGKPAASRDYLRWSANGTKDGDLVFVSGNPGGTFRRIDQRATGLRARHPLSLQDARKSRSVAGNWRCSSTRGPEQAREANDELFFLENGFKVLLRTATGAAGSSVFWHQGAGRATAARSHGSGSKARRVCFGLERHRENPASALAALCAQARHWVRRSFRAGLLGDAVTLVRAAAERTKPNGERLPEYTDKALVNVQQELTAAVPVYKDLEELELTFLFTVIRRDLGADDAFVRKMLGKESPEQLAHRLVTGTHLEDPKVREELYKGGQSAVDASTDPMIRFAASINDDLLAVRKEYEARVDAPTRAAAEKIAKARFAVYGTSVDPDATFTLRLTYGTVKGFENAEGKFVAALHEHRRPVRAGDRSAAV